MHMADIKYELAVNIIIATVSLANQS